eukprot:scaffold4647_cov80-Skeletonema_marinoi.AAC.2
MTTTFHSFFALCTPTKNDNDEIDAQDTIFGEDKSPRLMHFFLKPRPRRSRQCPTGWHQEQIGMRTDSALKDMAKDSTNEHIMKHNPSQQQQFTPISSVPITPPVVINLLKRCHVPLKTSTKKKKMKAMITRPPRCGRYRYFQASDGSQCSSRNTLFCVALLLVAYANANASKRPLLIAYANARRNHNKNISTTSLEVIIRIYRYRRTRERRYHS